MVHTDRAYAHGESMYFCLYCLSSKEETICTRITNLLSERFGDGFRVWFPKKEVREKKRGVYTSVEKPMFPNYLFIYWDGEVESEFPFVEIRRIPGVVRFLRYDDGSFDLKGNDLAFAKWIHMYGGFIKQSKVIFREGQKLHICEGPLRGFDGNVVKIDKHHKRITLRFEVAGNISCVSFSVEFLSNAVGEEKHEDSEATHSTEDS